MASLKEKFGSGLPAIRDEIRDLVKNYGDVVLSEATVAQAYGGMRGIKSLICDTSEVHPEKGLIIRGIPLLEITDKLPEECQALWLPTANNQGNRSYSLALLALEKQSSTEFLVETDSNIPNYAGRGKACEILYLQVGGS